MIVLMRRGCREPSYSIESSLFRERVISRTCIRLFRLVMIRLCRVPNLVVQLRRLLTHLGARLLCNDCLNPCRLMVQKGTLSDL